MYNVWQNVLAEIEQKIPANEYSIWFQDTSLISADQGEVRIGVKNTFYVKQLRSRYVGYITDALSSNGVEVNNIDFEVSAPKNTHIRSHEVTSASVAMQDRIKSIKTEPKATPSYESGLNSKFTLDTFVVGSNNDLAVSAARNIIENPGTRCNPFFLYGGPGLGKTHLVQAIGNEILRRNPDAKILYTPINHFYSDFVDAIQNGKGKEFNRKFQKLDVLIIDDFQFIVGKEKSQEEFFNIFNDLYQLNKQIIVTSDRLPNQIKSVDERLASRLTWAGAFDLQFPAFEDRCAILKAKAEYQGANIEPEAIEYIAENVTTNIRDLEGEFAKILLLSDVRHITPLELIRNGAVSVDNKTSKMRGLSPKQVIDKVAKYYDLTSKDILGASRVANIKTARQVVMFLLSKELSMSTPKIGAELGGKDHTTVMHGIKKIETSLRLDFNLQQEIAEIKERIYS